MSKIEVIEYKDKYKSQWEEFVQKSNNGTMFHRQAFLDYHSKGRFDFHHLIFKKSGKIVGLLPGGLKNNGAEFWSPTGASYGSIVTGDIPFRLALEITDTMMEYFDKNGFKDIYLIPAPLIYSHNYSQHIEYSMLYRKFDFELHYISHAIELKHGEDFLSFFDKTARKTVRKVLREGKIRIEESDDYETFNKILIDNKAKHDVKPTHTLEEMLKLKELLPGNIRLLMVYYGDIPIAGSWLFFCNSKVTLCFYNMLDYNYEHLKPVYLIMYETVRRSYLEGYRWVDIGVSQDTSADDPMTPQISLINFKERFDSRGILRSTYHFKFRD